MWRAIRSRLTKYSRKRPMESDRKRVSAGLRVYSRRKPRGLRLKNYCVILAGIAKDYSIRECSLITGRE